MAKGTTGRSRFKLQRALGLELPGLGRPGALERRPYGPGVHGGKRKKISDYAIRLREKQKLVYHYGIREKQLVNYVKKSKKIKERAWMDTLLMSLESRLNNALFRLNMAPSIPAASQMIGHGQVLVNGKKVDVTNYHLQVGDVISLTEKGYKNQLYRQSLESPRMSGIPACYKIEGDENKKATLIESPLPSDVPFEFHGQLVTEYYWKVS